jgi:hypothetical protein
MGMLEQVQKGRKSGPPRIGLYGIEGIGKSSWGAQAPSPVFIDIEGGLGQIDCHRFPQAKTFNDVIASLTELEAEKHDYQTVVIDSLDWLERLIFDETCREFGVRSIEKVDGGYGKGYVHALMQWRKVLDRLDALRTRGMACILIAHAKVERFEDPENPAYDRYSPRLHKHATALICEWCDCVLFATRKYRTEKEAAGFGRERTIAVGIGQNGGERILRTEGGPSCIAKNRYSLPAELPLLWSALMSALTGKEI